MTPEQKVKNEILQWLFLQPNVCMAWTNQSTGLYSGGRWRKQNSPYFRKGTPDILGVWDGHPLAIECKSKTGRLSPEQKSFLEEFAKHGGISILARRLDDVLKGILEWQSQNPKRNPRNNEEEGEPTSL